MPSTVTKTIEVSTAEKILVDTVDQVVTIQSSEPASPALYDCWKAQIRKENPTLESDGTYSWTTGKVDEYCVWVGRRWEVFALGESRSLSVLE